MPLDTLARVTSKINLHIRQYIDTEGDNLSPWANPSITLEVIAVMSWLP